MIFHILSIPLLAALTASVADPSGHPAHDVKCGAYCLFVGLKALGLAEESYSEFEKGLPTPGPEGYSMEELDRIAIGKGAVTLATEASLDTLSTVSRPSACIAFVDRHFLLIKWISTENRRIALIDPPLEYEQSFADFEKRFSKRSLILGTSSSPPRIQRSHFWTYVICGSLGMITVMSFLRKVVVKPRSRSLASLLISIISLSSIACGPSPSPAGETPPPLRIFRIDPAESHLGKVFASSADKKVTASTLLINDSDKPIKIFEVKKSCTCTDAKLEALLIPPANRRSSRLPFP